LAFNYGFSAWWFTLGGGIGSLVLGLVFAKPLYTSGVKTVTQVISREFGEKAAFAAVLLVSIGSFLSIVAQVLSGSALITSISPLPALLATLLLIVLMLIYVVFGGVWGAGIVGIVKTLMLCAVTGVCGFLALNADGGFSAYLAAFPHERYFNLFARGPAADLGAGLSLVLGVVTSQPYIQSVISGKSLGQAKAGVLVSAALIPLIGLGGVFVGLYMKLYHPDIAPAQALPLFIMQKFPAAVAGAAFAVLLVAVVGTGAGVALGISSLISGDVYKTFFRPKADDKEMLIASRLFIVAVLLLAALFSFGNAGSLILSWSFLSMGLRGAVVFGVLVMALWFPGRLQKKYAIASIVAAPLFVILGKFLLPASIDSLFVGVIGSSVIMLCGCIRLTANKR
jgi:SSS family solute:Na+ symporter